MSPVPEINFTGPVDDALLPAAWEQLLGLLREALAASGTTSGLASVAVEAGEELRVTVTGGGTARGDSAVADCLGRHDDQDDGTVTTGPCA